MRLQAQYLIPLPVSQELSSAGVASANDCENKFKFLSAGATLNCSPGRSRT